MWVQDLHALPHRSHLAFFLALLAALFWGLLPLPSAEIPNLWTWMGMAAVVGGSALCALGATNQAAA